VIVGAEAGIARETSMLSRAQHPFGRLPVDIYDVGTVDQCVLPSSYSSSISVG